MQVTAKTLIALLISIAVLADEPTPPKQALCPECNGKAFTADVGVCEDCGADTASGAFELCPKCAFTKGLCQACGKPLAGPEEFTLETEDGWKLAATFTPHQGAEGRGGVVLLHMLGRTRADWAQLTPELTKAGLDVLAIDLRGHGQSSARSWKDFTDAEFQGLVVDAASAVKALRARPSVANKPVLLIGGSIGANAAVRLAAQDATITGVVALSPGLEYHDVTTEDVIPGLGERPIFLAASKDDEYSAQTVEKLASLAKGPKELILYAKAGHGTDMFGKEDSPGALTQSISAWVESILGK
ncbi:MAG: alpha/beta fold hydrolase [Planctomycetota bacterium]